MARRHLSNNTVPTQHPPLKTQPQPVDRVLAPVSKPSNSARNLDGSAARNLDGSAARNLGGSAARNLDGYATRTLDESTCCGWQGGHSRVLCGRCCSGERTSEGVSAGAGGEQRGGGARASSETVAAAAMQLEVDLDGVSVVLRVGAGQSVAEAVGGFMRSHGLEESMRGALLDAVAEVLRASLSTDERERESESESERGAASPSADAACTL
jgi:hypothetical protein